MIDIRKLDEATNKSLVEQQIHVNLMQLRINIM